MLNKLLIVSINIHIFFSRCLWYLGSRSKSHIQNHYVKELNKSLGSFCKKNNLAMIIGASFEKEGRRSKDGARSLKRVENSVLFFSFFMSHPKW
jgi:hypothetical protein